MSFFSFYIKRYNSLIHCLKVAFLSLTIYIIVYKSKNNSNQEINKIIRYKKKIIQKYNHIHIHFTNIIVN